MIRTEKNINCSYRCTNGGYGKKRVIKGPPKIVIKNEIKTKNI